MLRPRLLLLPVLLLALTACSTDAPQEVSIPAVTLPPASQPTLSALPPFRPSDTPYVPVPTSTSAPTPAPRLGPTPLPPDIPANATVLENAGVICLQTSEDSTGLRGTFDPGGCYSISCTLPADVSLQVQVDQPRFVLRFFTRFTLFNPNPPEIIACSADCGGAGTLSFDLGELERWDPLESTCRHASLSIL